MAVESDPQGLNQPLAVEQGKPRPLALRCCIPSLGGVVLPLRHVFSFSLFFFFWLLELALSPSGKGKARLWVSCFVSTAALSSLLEPLRWAGR